MIMTVFCCSRWILSISSIAWSPALRVESGERLVEEQDAHVVVHDAGERDLLLLSAREGEGGVGGKPLHPHDAQRPPHLFEHDGARDAVVLQREGDVLPHREPRELAVGILHDGADAVAELMDVEAARLVAHDLEAAGELRLDREGQQPFRQEPSVDFPLPDGPRMSTFSPS